MAAAAWGGRSSASTLIYPIRGCAFVAARPFAFRKFLRAAAIYALTSAAVLAVCFKLLFEPQHHLLVGLLGHTWLAWQIASGAVLAEASWPLFLLLQFRQSDMTDSLFGDVLREVGITELTPLPVAERTELQEFVVGRPGESRPRSWARLTLSGPLLLFWPYGPVLYAWLNAYGSGAGHHVFYLKAKGVEDPDEQEAVTASRAGQYRGFGFTAMLLSLIPVVGWGLSLMSAAGAALWAAELEGVGSRSPSKLYQGGMKTHDGMEYGLVGMEEGR